jgi:hypothetical protein
VNRSLGAAPACTRIGKTDPALPVSGASDRPSEWRPHARIRRMGLSHVQAPASTSLSASKRVLAPLGVLEGRPERERE